MFRGLLITRLVYNKHQYMTKSFILFRLCRERYSHTYSLSSSFQQLLKFSHPSYLTFNKKTELSQRWPRDAPNIWVPWRLYASAKSVDDCARISTLFTILSLL